MACYGERHDFIYRFLLLADGSHEIKYKFSRNVIFFRFLFLSFIC